MASNTDRAPQRRARKAAPSDAVLKANEQLIKSRFYSWALATSSGWLECQDAVVRKTGIKIPVETFRQNFQPTNAKRGVPPRSFGKKHYLRAIYDFICAVGYCNTHTLASPDDGMDAALALGAYIGANSQAVPLAGSFRSEVVHAATTESFELDIIAGKKGGITRVFITETVEEFGSEVPLEKLHRQGWFVGNDSGMVLMFTRHEDEGPELFLLLQSAPVLGAEAPPDKLALLRYHAAARVPLSFAPGTDIAAHLGALTPGKLLERSILHLTRVGSDAEVEAPKRSKKRHFAPSGGKDWPYMTASTNSIDEEFLALVKSRDYNDTVRAIALVPQVRDINVRDPKTGCTALHLAAAVSSRKLIDALEQRPDLDYSLRDNRGFLASDRAWVDGQSQQLGMELAQKEIAQAQQARSSAPAGPSKS